MVWFATALRGRGSQADRLTRLAASASVRMADPTGRSTEGQDVPTVVLAVVTGWAAVLVVVTGLAVVLVVVTVLAVVLVVVTGLAVVLVVIGATVVVVVFRVFAGRAPKAEPEEPKTAAARVTVPIRTIAIRRMVPPRH